MSADPGTAPSRVEHLLWRQAPEDVEQLIRDALGAPRQLSDSMRAQLEVSLAYALMHQHRFLEARAALAAQLDRGPSAERDLALLCDAQLAFYLDEPWPAPWDKFEARWSIEFSGDHPVPTDRLWDGSPLDGRSVLLAGEGGMGDQVQFVRFAETLKRAGAGRVIVSAHPPLLPLFETVAGVDAVVPTRMPSHAPAVEVEHDVAIPMLSVPRFLSPTVYPWPSTPYLHVSPGAVADARQVLAAQGQRFNVGVCWQSRKLVRCMPLELFRPFADVPGVRLFAIGDRDTIQDEIGDFPIEDISSDVATTAARIAALDLAITVDTMTVHLAGALGCPVWMPLHYLPDWRWKLEGDTSSWYPSLRLFRQERRDWGPVIERMTAALRASAADSRLPA